MIGVKKCITLGSMLSVLATFSLPTAVYAQNTRIIPPKIDFESCIKPIPPMDDLAKRLKTSSVANSGIRDNDLISLAALFKNGSRETPPDITKTVEIIEYLINKDSIKPLLKARALKIKAQLKFAGQGYVEDSLGAKNILRDVIQNTDPTAKLNLAKMLEAEGNFKDAEPLYQSLLKEKNLDAALALSFMYNRRNIIVPDDKIKNHIILAQNMLLEKLAQGQCEYFGKIGQMYINLRGLDNHEQYAAEWLLPASRFDDAQSKQQLAVLIKKGYLSDVKDKPSEITLLKEAAELGSADAMHDLGQILLKTPDTESEAIAWFEKSAERQNMQAIERLIKLYKNNPAKRDDYLYWLEMASTHDEIDHELLVDYADTLKRSQNPDHKKIFALYEHAARLGNDEAMFEMGEAYKYGLGVEKNPTKALRFYRLSTQKANLDAYEAIVDAYTCGIGKSVNADLANKWSDRGEYFGLSSIYDKMDNAFQNVQTNEEKTALVKNYIPQLKLIARDKKSTQAMVRLSVMYDFLNDGRQSQSWLDRALSKSDNGEAHYHYAKELKNGIIVPANIQKSNDYMKQAADKNNKSALKRLGQTMEKQKQFEKALEIYKKSYELGDQSSALKIADMEHALGNNNSALSYLKKAASHNDAEAMFALAKAYSQNGWIKPYNPELSKQWFNRATQSYICDTGDIIKIVESYIEGKNGVEKDLDMAFQWLSKVPSMDTLSDGDRLSYIALILDTSSLKNRPEYKTALNDLETMANNHNTKAIHMIADYYLNTVPETEKALYWLTKSADAGDDKAMLKLGKLYMTGHMVEQSLDKASQWFQKAANDNNIEAIELLKVMNNQ